MTRLFNFPVRLSVLLFDAAAGFSAVPSDAEVDFDFDFALLFDPFALEVLSTKVPSTLSPALIPEGLLLSEWSSPEAIDAVSGVVAAVVDVDEDWPWGT